MLDAQPSVAAPAGPGRLIIIHTGKAWAMMHWDPANWVTLLRQLHEEGAYRFVFVGGGTVDEADYATIAPALGFPTTSLIGKLDVAETLDLMRAADGFIGIDSGPANLARLAELPNVTLYGPGPHMYLPFRPGDIALDKTRGRGLTQMFVATKRNFIGMITPDEVRAALHRLDLAKRHG